MSGEVLRRLARPHTAADRRRAALISLGVAGAGVFLLAALAILTDTGDDARLSDYVTESGLRGGTAFGAALLVVPFVLFALQAMRTGTAARERRLAALSLAGATGPDLRRLAFLEGTRAAVLGALAAGPAYLVLWLVFGVAVPPAVRMLPVPRGDLAAGWAGLVVVLGLAGGLVARRAARPASVSPLGLTRRRPRPLTAASAVVPVTAALVVAAGLWVTMTARTALADVGLVLVLVALVVLAISSGAWLILLTGRLAARRRGLTSAMAGRRLLADVRSPGRVVGVLLAVGFAFGVIAVLVVYGTNPNYQDVNAFYVTGNVAAVLGGLVAAVVACSSLVVGATEQVLDGRRAVAILTALAASPSFVLRVVRRQLLLAAVPALVIGAALGWLAYGGLSLADGLGAGWLLLALLAAVLVAALAGAIGALVAARAVWPAILSSSTADNLRAP